MLFYKVKLVVDKLIYRKWWQKTFHINSNWK